MFAEKLLNTAKGVEPVVTGNTSCRISWDPLQAVYALPEVGVPDNWGIFKERTDQCQIHILFAVGDPVEISNESEGAVGLLEGVGDIYIYGCST